MALNFPTSPNLNDLYSLGTRTWKFNGSGWQVVPPLGPIGYTGSAGTGGTPGADGVSGYTGSVGFTGSGGNTGYSGSAGFTGSAGAGYTGSAGTVGYTGSIGYTGSTSEATSVTVSPIFKGALVSASSTQTLSAAATWTTLTNFDSVVYDTDNFRSVADRFTIPAGVTKVKLSGSSLGESATDQFICRITKNGSATYSTVVDIDTTGADSTVAVTPVLEVVAGDYFEFQGYSQSSSRSILATTSSWFSIEVVEGGILDTTSVIRTVGYTGSNGESSFVFSDEPPANPLVGDRWYDTTLGLEFVWIYDGDTTQWVEITTAGNGEQGYTGSSGGTLPAAITSETFTGDGVEVEFTLSVTPLNKNETAINIDGVTQLRSAYSLSGATITFSSAPANGAIIEVTITTGYVAITGTLLTRVYTGNGVQTGFLVTAGVTSSSLLVLENGVLQVPEVDYTVSGNTLTFATAPASSVTVQIRELSAFVPAGTVTGVTGGGTDRVFFESDQIITANYTITAGKNAITAGPVTISTGTIVTIPTGSRWVIV